MSNNNRSGDDVMEWPEPKPRRKWTMSNQIKEIRYCTILEATTHKGETQYFWIEPDKTKMKNTDDGIVSIGVAPRGPFRTSAEAEKDYDAVIFEGKKFVDGGMITDAPLSVQRLVLGPNDIPTEH
jgi:hypothetical protein